MSALVLGLYGPLTFLLVVVVITPQLTVSIRRLHDTDRSGWWLLLGPVPMAVMGVIAFVPLGWMVVGLATAVVARSEEHTSELQSLMRISYAVFCLKKKTKRIHGPTLTLKIKIRHKSN